MITDAFFYAIAIPAVLLSGISKGGLSGLGELAVPMLALVISPTQAAGLMLPILCLMDLFGRWAYMYACEAYGARPACGPVSSPPRS